MHPISLQIQDFFIELQYFFRPSPLINYPRFAGGEVLRFDSFTAWRTQEMFRDSGVSPIAGAGILRCWPFHQQRFVVRWKIRETPGTQHEGDFAGKYLVFGADYFARA
jgi:hypothetical protein